MKWYLLTHNWNQLKTFFETVGYHQVPSRNVGLTEKFLFFRDEKTGRTIGFEKTDKLSVDAVKLILRRVDFTYEYFVKMFYRDDKNNSN